jgi:hypothetical protein
MSHQQRSVICATLAIGLSACTAAPLTPACQVAAGRAAAQWRDRPRAAHRPTGGSHPGELGLPIDLVWPRGFSARLVGGRAELVAPDGTVVIREGDVVSDIISGVPNICAVNGVLYPPAA